MVAPASVHATASSWVSELDGAADVDTCADAGAAVEAELVGLARSEGPLRCALAELAATFAEGEGFARLGFVSMGAHVLRAWGALGEKVRREHRVFARDGWRSSVPGCSKLRNLHAHHVVYRAQGGGDERENLTTLCAYHHLRGVHAGTLRIRGLAPHALRFELGLRERRAPLAVYASGDRRVEM